VIASYIALPLEESPARVQGSVGRGTGFALAGLWMGIRGYLPLFRFLVLPMSGFSAFSHGSQDLHPVFLQSDHHLDPLTVSLIGIVLAPGAIAGGIVFGSLSLGSKMDNYHGRPPGDPGCAIGHAHPRQSCSNDGGLSAVVHGARRLGRGAGVPE